MAAADSVNLTSLTDHRRVLSLWKGVIVAGLLIFAGLLVFSYFVLNAPSITHNAAEYKRAEAALGFSELGGLVLSVLALFRYVNVKNKYHELVFRQFVADNRWTVKRKFDLSKVPSILLGAGEDYEQGFGFDGTHSGRSFNCLIFEYVATDSKSRRFICLGFKLLKPYPMIVIDNRRNDHKLRHHDSDLPDRIPNGVELTLEGYFNKYYRVSTTKGDEQETLEVLTPEFMAALEDHVNDKVDVEISNKDLFLIYEADYYSEQSITSLFDMADVVLGKLDKLSKTWLASSKSQQNAVSESAETARHKLIFRSDWISAIAFLVLFVVFVLLMISHIKTEQPCTQTDPCYPAPTFHGD